MPLPSRSKSKSGTPEKKSVSGGRPKTSTSLQTTVKSNSSTSSNESLGIGQSHTTARPPPPDAALRFRLMPEGLGTNVLNVYEQVAYDCLVTVVSCTAHGTVALTAPSDWTRMYAYFPFIPLQDTFTWKRISRDGMALIFKSDVASGEDETSFSLPDYTTTWLGVSRVQLPSATSTKFCTRVLQHVQLQTEKESKEANCCQDNSRIRWLKLADVVKCENLWSDEVISVCKAISGEETSSADFIYEINDRAMMESVSSEEHLALLSSLNWSEKLVSELLEDYVRHMYPAMNMSVNSLAAFLQKYGLVGKRDKKNIRRLFRAFAAINDAGTLSFPQLLIGLAVMDPEATNDQEPRAKFIFKYVLISF